MVIIDERVHNVVDFESLDPGEVFFDRYNDATYMKLHKYYSEYNAVDLQSGKLDKFGDSVQVIPLKAHLGITN